MFKSLTIGGKDCSQPCWLCAVYALRLTLLRTVRYYYRVGLLRWWGCSRNAFRRLRQLCLQLLAHSKHRRYACAGLILICFAFWQVFHCRRMQKLPFASSLLTWQGCFRPNSIRSQALCSSCTDLLTLFQKLTSSWCSPRCLPLEGTTWILDPW